MFYKFKTIVWKFNVNCFLFLELFSKMYSEGEGDRPGLLKRGCGGKKSEAEKQVL